MAQAMRQIDGVELPPAGAYTIDPAHTSVVFVIRHLLSRARGRFTSFTGQIEVGETPEASTVAVDIEAASVSTDQEMRDNHLRSSDFFLTEEHPTITFRSTGVRLSGGNAFELDGDLTIRGITNPVTLDAEFLGMGATMDGTPMLGFSAKTTVDREAWDINWNAAIETGGMLLGKKVDLEIEVELLKAV